MWMTPCVRCVRLHVHYVLVNMYIIFGRQQVCSHSDDGVRVCLWPKISNAGAGQPSNLTCFLWEFFSRQPFFSSQTFRLWYSLAVVDANSILVKIVVIIIQKESHDSSRYKEYSTVFLWNLSFVGRHLDESSNHMATTKQWILIERCSDIAKFGYCGGRRY